MTQQEQERRKVGVCAECFTAIRRGDARILVLTVGGKRLGFRYHHGCWLAAMRAVAR